MATFRMVVAFIMAIPMFITPYVQLVFHGGIDSFFEKWSVSSAYTADYAIEIEKDPTKDFKVLNFADIQLNPSECFGENGAIAEETVRRCVKEVEPDLITLSGDNAWGGELSYIQVVKFIDSLGIPWAPIMGNHDGSDGNREKEYWCASLLANAKNCLFKYGPMDMGYGNYVINITENGKVIHTLFMMDSHSNANDTEAGRINYGKNDDGSDSYGYDHFWANQIEWYEWAVKGIAEQAGKTVESTVIMHIPVFEYIDAAQMACDFAYDDKGKMSTTIKAGFAGVAFGSLNESICAPKGNNGFFAKCLELGSTKNMICGHDHNNDLSVVYQGIRLSYSLKCGPGCYYQADNEGNMIKNGGSVLTINSRGVATFSHHPVVMKEPAGES